MTSVVSTRARTRNTGRYVRSTPGSQSLERGLRLLRAFRHGAYVLTNAELAERSSLPRPTVSRLTRSLVDAGFLAYEVRQQGYRLTAACLSLALSFRSAEPVLAMALPAMRELAEGRRVNVGLAVADELDMVYLESVRYSRLGLFRRLQAGTRIPIAETALGRAYLAGMTPPARRDLLDALCQAGGEAWPSLSRHVDDALASVAVHGYCLAKWQAGMAAIATPLVTLDGGVYAVNVSFPCPEGDTAELVREHVVLLLALVRKLRHQLDMQGR